MKQLVLLVLLFSVVDFTMAQLEVEEATSVAAGELRPIGGIEYRVVVIEDNNSTRVLRRRLAPYELCLVCKCCAANTTCITMPCCFGIDCQLPNKPYGVCAFLPKACNCTPCAS